MESTGPDLPDLQGRHIDERFVIGTRIGATLRVYDAEQRPLGRRVAIKFPDLPGRSAQPEERLDRFHLEAAALAGLTSPHAVRVIDVGAWDGMTYLVMEYIDGIPLSRVLKAGALGPARAIGFALQICDALEEAHAHGLLHGDLQPDNVLLSGAPESLQWVKLVGWRLGDDVPAAPIQREERDSRIDIHAVGALLLHMLTGAPALGPGGPPGDVVRAQRSRAPKRSDAMSSASLMDILDAIVQRALAEGPTDRYATVSDLVRDVGLAQRIVQGDATPTAQFAMMSTGTRRAALSRSLTSRPPPRRRWSILGVVIAALVVLATAVAEITAVRDARPLASERVSGTLTGEITWTAEHPWILTGPVLVDHGRLTVAGGALVLGEAGSILVVTRSATLRAQGRADSPIVFTSAKPVGQRAPGDWGGVVLLSDAPIHAARSPSIAGLPAGDVRGRIGGDLAAASCGELDYVRIEFAGGPIGGHPSLGGLTLGGCGSGTLVRHVQVHRALGDGIALLGGTADLSHVLITQPAGNALGRGLGWSGREQYLEVQRDPPPGDAVLDLVGPHSGLSWLDGWTAFPAH